MPEVKYLRRPGREIIACDERGQAVDLVALQGRRIKWARRKGHKITAMVEGSHKGARGTLLIFRNSADYEDAVCRVLKRETD